MNYCNSGQVLFVRPGFLQRVHECFLFRVSDSMPFSVVIFLGVADTEADEVGAEVCVLVVGADRHADEVEEGLGAEGRGHVMSAARVDLQCIRMFLYKYHCLVTRVYKREERECRTPYCRVQTHFEEF